MKALTKIDREVAVLDRVRKRIVARNRRILSYVADAPMLAANGGAAPPEWDKGDANFKVRVQVARDANLSKRHAPVYLEFAKSVVETSDKLEAMRSGGVPVQLNIGAINVVQAPQYPEIIVQAIERKT